MFDGACNPRVHLSAQISWQADGQLHSSDDDHCEGHIFDKHGPRREYQDAIRAIFFRRNSLSVEVAASVLGRGEAWVRAHWAQDPAHIPVPTQVPRYIKDHALRCLTAEVEPFRRAELHRGYFTPCQSTMEALRRLAWEPAPVITRNYENGIISDTGLRVKRERYGVSGVRTGLPLVDEVLSRVKKDFGVSDPGAYLLCNRYPNGQAFIAPHQHDFWSATLSFGAPRVFLLDDKPLLLQDGDLLVFGNQRHSVPQMPQTRGDRVSVSLFWSPDWEPDWYSQEKLEAWMEEVGNGEARIEKHAANMEILQQLGFPEVACKVALEKYSSVDEAATFLLQELDVEDSLEDWSAEIGSTPKRKIYGVAWEETNRSQEQVVDEQPRAAPPAQVKHAVPAKARWARRGLRAKDEEASFKEP